LEHLLTRHLVGAPLGDSITMRVSKPASTRIRSKALAHGLDYTSLARAALIKGWRELFDEDLNAVL
jgi:hypothetical protein